MSLHVTVDTLQRFRRGELPADEVLLVSRHLAGCSECASRSREQVNADAVAAWMRTFLADAPDLREARRPMAVRRRNRTASWLIAAGIAGVALGGAWLRMTQRDDVRVRPPQSPVKIARTSPAATPAGYGDADWDRLVADARRDGFVPMPRALHALQAEPDSLRGRTPGAQAVTFTPGGAIVESTRPELRWPATEGARYVVLIFREDEEVSRSAPLAGASWTPAKPLARGATYEWQVEVRRGGDTTLVPAPPDPPAMFAVLDANAAAAIEEARRRFPNDHLLAGLLYARAGVREEAIRELESWIAAHPDDRRAAEILLSIRRW